MRNYFRKHTVGDFFERLTTGARNQLALFWGGSHEWAANRESWDMAPAQSDQPLDPLRGAYVAALGLLTLSLAAVAGGWRALDDAARTHAHCRGALRRAPARVRLYTHYTPLSRFMLSLYIPLAFSLAWAAESLRRRRRSRGSTGLCRRAPGDARHAHSAPRDPRAIPVSPGCAARFS
jgi:hypothetical protein